MSRRLQTLRRRYLGDRAFYAKVLRVAVPLIIQQLITSFVNMLDNIMVGQTGTLAMSGVSIANQLTTVYFMAVFGSVSAASIFGAQFAGNHDTDGVRECLRFKLVTELLIAAAGMILFRTAGRQLLVLFTNPEVDSAENISATMEYASAYLRIMTFSFIPMGLSQALSASFREAGETRYPMLSSITAVAVNFTGNWILIFGHLGFPAMGPSGAAIATVLSRFAELAVIIAFAVLHKSRFPFFTDVFRHFGVPRTLAVRIIIKGLPLVANEVLYSAGVAAVTQCYSVRGIDALAAYNISSTITQLFFVFNIALGDSISIIVGQLLGAGMTEKAVDSDRKMIALTLIVSVLLGLILIVTAGLFPEMYNTGREVKTLAASLLRIAGALMWVSSIYNASYFTMRCGGKTILTFLFDSVGTIAVSFPLAWCLAHFTSLPVTYMYMIVHGADVYKVILGLILVHKRIWVNNLVAGQEV